MVQHLLSIVVGDGGSLDAKVSEHCIGFPSAEKADGIRVNARTEEGSGPARTKGSGGDFAGGDASGGGAMVCGMPQGIGNKGGFDGVPPLLVEVEVHEERRVEGCLVDSEMSNKAGETFARTEEWVRCGGVANLFPTGGILLVVESESGMGDATRIHQVIQRTVHSRVDLATNGEADILETKGLGSGIRRVGIQVFSRAQQPEECCGDEIDGGFVELSLTSMSSVKGVRESSENCHIYWVGAIGWIVFIPESLEVSREYRVEFFGSRSLLSWIWLTQVGDPLANGKKGLIH